MYNKCCVVNCASRRKDVNLHMFPKTKIGLQKWLESINCERLRSLSLQELRKQFVCRGHFEKKFLASTRNRARLRSGAYPTLFTNSEIASGIPRTDAAVMPEKTVHFTCEHDYAKKRLHNDHTYCISEVMEERSRTQTDMAAMSLAHFDKIEMALSMALSHVDETDDINQPCTSSQESSNLGQGRKSDEIAPCTPHRTPSLKRKHVICTKNRLTPNCSRLYREYAKCKRKLNFHKKAKRALKLSKTKFFELFTNKMNPLTKKFVWMQVKQCTKKARGRRFSDEEKLIALSIMKQSPKCYRFLHNIFILPSEHTLNKMIARKGAVCQELPIET